MQCDQPNLQGQCPCREHRGVRGVHCISSTSAAGAVTQETSSSLQARPGAKGEVLHPLESTSPSQRIAHPHLQLQFSSDTGSLVPSCNTWGTYCPKPTLTHGHRRPGAGCQVVFCSISWGGIFLRRQILEHSPWT